MPGTSAATLLVCLCGHCVLCVCWAQLRNSLARSLVSLGCTEIAGCLQLTSLSKVVHIRMISWRGLQGPTGLQATVSPAQQVCRPTSGRRQVCITRAASLNGSESDGEVPKMPPREAQLAGRRCSQNPGFLSLSLSLSLSLLLSLCLSCSLPRPPSPSLALSHARAYSLCLPAPLLYCL